MLKMRKMITVFAIIVFSMLAGAALAETSGDWTYSVSGGEATITGYSGTDAALVIPDELGGYPVTAIKSGACFANDTITSIVFPDSLRSIGSQAFYNCDQLTSIVLPESLKRIGSLAFANSAKLGDVFIPESVQEIDGGAFATCDAMKAITVDPDNPNYVSVDGVLFTKDMKQILCYPADKPGDTYGIPSGVEVIGRGAFDGANHLQHVGIPDSVTRIEDSAFAIAFEIEEIVLPDGVTHIGTSAFYGMHIDSIVFPDSVQEIGEQALKSSAVSSVVLPEGLERIENHMFSLCDKLTSVNIPDSVKSIGQLAFFGCKSLTSLVLPEGLTKIEYEAFTNCSELESIVLPKSVTSIDEEAFVGCEKLVAQVYENSYAHIWCEENNVKYILIEEPADDPSVEVPPQDVLDSLPKTGDSAKPGMWLALLVASAYVLRRMRKCEA